MDSTVVAALLGAVVAGAGGLLVPRLIALVPPWEPPPPEESPDATSETDATVDATDETVRPPEPPEPYAEIAELPGLAWKSAVAGVLAGAGLGAAVGWEWAWVLWVPFVPVYLALAVIDWRTRLLPTYLIWPSLGALAVLVLVGWAVTGDGDAVVRAGLGMVTCSAFYGILWLVYPRGLGFGDVRLSAPLGFALGWAGWGQVLIGVYAGFLLGGLIGGMLALVKIVERKGFPFGPFMLLGSVIGLLWGDSLWSGLVGG